MSEEKIIEILNRRTKQLKLIFAITNEDLEAIESAVSLLEEKNRIIKDQSKTNKKLRDKLHGYRRLLKLKEKHLNILNDKLMEKHYNI